MIIFIGLSSCVALVLEITLNEINGGGFRESGGW